jgi:hypothetical protein
MSAGGAAIVSDWSIVIQIVGAASATLMGLLFVAIQLNREWIVKYPTLRGRAIETLLILGLPLVASILLAIPGQSVRSLGAELVILGIIHGLGVIAANSKRKEGAPVTPLDRRLSHATPALLTTVFTLVSGAMLAAGRASGLYWLVATMILALVGGVASAWIFLIGNPE